MLEHSTESEDGFKIVGSGVGGKNVVYEWGDQVRNYGWSKEMVKQFYGDMAQEEENELKKK